MIFKNTTLRLSLALALLELAIWLSLGVFASSGSENFWVLLLTYSADRFGEISVAIATTFYVVFTYRLLENTEVQRKHSTEPHLMKRWYQSAKPTDDQLSCMGIFADKSRSLIETFTSNPNGIDEANMATGDRYLIFELSNVRETPVGWITLAVTGTLNIPDIPLTNKFRDKLHLPNLNISGDKKVEVTMVDLFPIPQSAEVTLDIEVMAYGAIGGGDVIDESSGDFKKSAAGEFMPPESDGPQPHLTKKTEG